MKKALTLALLVALLTGLVVAPASAWVYPNGSKDDLWEPFGPRIDKLLIKLYSTAELEWDALQAGDIDITDWPLTAEYKSKLEADSTVNVVYMGAEYGMRNLDINNYPYAKFPNGETFELYPNPCSVPAFRHALWHCINRDWIVTSVLGGLGEPLYTHVGSPWGPAQHPEIKPGGLLEDLTHPYNLTEAARILDEAGFVDTDSPPDGIRNFPTSIGGNGQNIVLKFFVRSDDIERKTVGERLATEIESLGITVQITYGDSAAAKSQVMTPKDNFHLYTAGWGLSPDLDYLMLWSIDWYWHPGRPPNWSACNDTEVNRYAYEAMVAPTYEAAVAAAHGFQEAMNSPDAVCNAPLWISAGYTAYKKYYTGGNNGQAKSPDDGENQYRGQNWLGIVNEFGTGVFGWWTFMNAHPEGADVGTGTMTMRWGFKTSTLKSINPFYAEWVWDHYVLGKIYDSLLGADPYKPFAVMAGAEVPYIAYNWTVGTYVHPDYGTCTKITFHLRDDVYWNDGTQFTSADVKFSLRDGWIRALERGFPYPWWIGSVSDVLAVDTPDPFTAIVYFDILGVWCIHYSGWMIMMPRHIWWPIVDTGNPYAPELPPDCPAVGTGPFMWDSMGPGGTEFVLLKKYTKENAGKDHGFFKQTPIYPTPVITQPTEHARIIPPPATITFKLDLHNYWLNNGAGSTIGVTYYVWFVNITEGTEQLVETGTASLPNCTTVTKGPWTKTDLGPAKYGIRVAVHIDDGPWASTWVNISLPMRFWVTIREDTNLDISVNYLDAIIVGAAFGSAPGDTNWDVRADIKEDRVINYLDAILLGAKFGWPY